MKAYKVVSGVLHVGAGAAIGLALGQAASRGGLVAPVEGRAGAYRAGGVLRFKTGEIIGLDDLVDAIGKGQLDKVAVATEEDLRELFDREQLAGSAARKAKAAAREKAKSLVDQKSALRAAQEEGRKAGHAEGLKAGRAEGEKAGYERGFAEGKAAALAEVEAAAKAAQA